jgi:PKHD-type hydroxylase
MITNNLNERVNVTYPFVWWDKAFTDDHLREIEKYCSTLPAKEGSVIGGADVDKVRKSKVAFFNKNEFTGDIFNTFNGVLNSLNDQFYGMNLYGYDMIQYTEYHGDEEGKYDWHMDSCIANENPLGLTRKLSMTMLLNEPGVDFEGGEFQLNTGREAKPTTANTSKGRAIVFPSFLIHRVAPVTKGVRKSLVIWVNGPKFV